jgi:hypothetical protein
MAGTSAAVAERVVIGLELAVIGCSGRARRPFVGVNSIKGMLSPYRAFEPGT